MRRRRLLSISKEFITLALLFSILSLVVFAQRGETPPVEYYHVETVLPPNGREAEQVTINGPPEPPPGYVRPLAPSEGPGVTAAATLPVPAYDWSFGCTATSAAMIAAYYDRTGYPNMYTGPTDGGMMPMDNSVWPDWLDSGGAMRSQCPLSATHNGLDGRTTRGHVDDYWVQYGASGPDPYVTNGWTEHTTGDCTADFMHTNKWYATYGLNSDGATTYWYYGDGTKLYASYLEASGEPYSLDGPGVGFKNFYESRGYTVADAYTQRIIERSTNPTQGFTYNDYKAEIDAGRPVMIHVEGHTMVGVGYDDTVSNLMYIHDTWDYSTHTMTWGGSYSGMAHLAVSIVQLEPPSGPDAPSLTSPSNGSSTCDTTPSFNWDSSSGATLYRIQVDDGPSFSLPEIDTTSSSTSYTPGTALSPGTYSWRVQALGSFGDSPWSSVWSFTILATPSSPSLSSPTDGTSTCDTTPGFSWSGASGAASYHIQVDDSTSFVSPEINTTTSGTSYTPGTALAPGTYSWRVQASNACGDGAWSPVWSFTILAAPSSPSLTSPPDGSTIDEDAPTFSWDSVSGATSYQIQVDDSAGFGSPAVDTTTSNTSYTPGTPLSTGSYSWRVRASNACGDGAWSSVWSFAITTTPSTPSLSSPADDSSTCDTMPSFSWGSVSGATSYRIQVDDSASFSSPEIETSTPSTSYTPATALAPGTYSWRVQASGYFGDSPWSPVWSFTILTAPSSPSLTSPPDSSTIDEDAPTFSWDSVSGATSYQIQVDDGTGFGSPEVDATTSSTSYTPGTPLSTGSYSWRVRVSNACDTGTWSATWQVTIDTTTGGSFRIYVPSVQRDSP